MEALDDEISLPEGMLTLPILLCLERGNNG